MTNHISLSELTNHMLTEVFHHNHLLQENLRADYYENQIIHINEIRRHFRQGVAECRVSLFGHNHLLVNHDEADAFIAGVATAQDIYAFLTLSDEPLLQDAAKRLNYLSVASHEEYVKNSGDCAKAVDKLAERISQRFYDLLAKSQNKDELLTYFINHYAQEEIPDAHIIRELDGSTDYALYQKTVTTKTFY